MEQNTLTPATTSFSVKTTDEIPTQPGIVNTSELQVASAVGQCNTSKLTFENPSVHVTERDDTTSSEDEDVSSQLYGFAQSIFQECYKNAAPISNLDTAIHLFREALDRRPPPHPLRSDSRKDLARALFARFSLIGQFQDLDQAIFLLGEVMQELDDISMGTRGEFLLDRDDPVEHNSMFTADDDTSKLTELAKTTLANFNQSIQLSSLDTAIMLHREALLRGLEPHDQRLMSMGLAETLYARFCCTDHIPNLDEAILLLREVIKACPESHAYYVELLNHLSVVLATRFDRTGLLIDLREAMERHHDTLQVTDINNRREAYQLLNFATSLVKQVEQSGQTTELETAVSLFRRALQLLPIDHPNRVLAYNDLANTIWMRFERAGQLGDLDEAISLHREALKLRHAPHPDRCSSLNNLAGALKMRFDQSGQQEDLNEAILLHREALELRPIPHPDRSNSLSNLAAALGTQFEQSGHHEDLDEAMSFHREALKLRPAPHPLRATSLNNFGTALITQFEQTGKRDDIDKAISFIQEALRLRPAPHPDRPSSLNSLAIALVTRFEELGQHKELDEAISLYQEGCELLSASHPLLSTMLSNLASALMTQFKLSGQREDLDEVILLNRQALELRPAPHPGRSMYLNNLANALTTLFEEAGKRTDLDEAILCYQESLKLRPSPHPLRSSSLNNLANTLTIQFEQTGERKDLDEAISFHREALELRVEPHPDRSSSLINIVGALTKRFDRFHQHEDIDEAMSFNHDALELLPALHPLRSKFLNNLGCALENRFHQSGQHEDLEASVKAYHESLNALSSGHPDICPFSFNLGRTLANAYSHTHEADHLSKAMAAFRVAVTCEAASTYVRFRAAKSWARYADSNHESALDAYQAAIELLPRLAMLGLDLQSRQQALTSGSDGLARDAAACAIRSGQYDKAIELLEEGRAVFWSQALQLRTPMADLREAVPELERRLRHISLALERASLRDVSKHLFNTPQKVISTEQEASRFRHLNNEWLATLEEVRQLDGFQDFLRPNRLSTLQRAAANHPVIVLNASKTGCAALILTSTGVRHVLFPDLAYTEVTGLVDLIRCAIAEDARGCLLSAESRHTHVEGFAEQMFLRSDTLQLLRLPLERHVSRASNTSLQLDDIFRYVLCVLWVSVVEPVICSLGLQKSDVPPNLWWCPTGPFAFLPIHAAGMYLTERTESVSDYVVSSYTPTISALLSDIPLPTDSSKMMVVIQPETPGQKSLPCTLEELRKIEAYVSDQELVKLVPGFVKDVMSNLPATSIAHFACHGQQNPQNPLESALLLQDGPLKVSQIMQQPMPNASLAFLSACETAMGDESLPDEMIHLGATLLFAGFHGVVATMWTIADPDGPKIADMFYANLFKRNSSTTTDGFRPDTTQAARALHVAVAKLRSENVSFVRWVPFIHLGR